MAAAQICASMTAFDIDNGEDFTEYSERFEMFLLANGIAEADRKRAVFLATIGGPAYKLLRSLLGESVKTKPFADLVKAMKDHLQPEPNQIAERFHFFKRDRKQGESVGDYIAELRRLSERCGFGEALNTYLRDRFVCGLASERIQQKLLTVKDLTLEVALSTARSFETASRAMQKCFMGAVWVVHQPCDNWGMHRRRSAFIASTRIRPGDSVQIRVGRIPGSVIAVERKVIWPTRVHLARPSVIAVARSVTFGTSATRKRNLRLVLRLVRGPRVRRQFARLGASARNQSARAKHRHWTRLVSTYLDVLQPLIR